MNRRNFTVDDLLTMKDAGLVAVSAAAQVDGAAHIEDLGAGFVQGNLVLDITAIEVNGARSQGTLTLDTNPTGGNSSQGTLTLDTNPVDADNDTMVIGTTTYRFKETLAQVNDIKIGATKEATQASIVATINGTGVAGTDYFAGTTSPHPLVRMAAFALDASVITAIATGVAGDAIDTTSSFTAGTNQFDDVTLGTTRAGADGDTMTIGTKVYYFDANGQLDDIDGHIEVGANVAATQAAIVNAINLTGTPGTGYAATMTIHPTVSMAAFAADDAVLTAKTPGVAGDLIVTTETFAHASNVFDDNTLGTTRAGSDGNERYDILLQGSNSATFASGIVVLARVAVGESSVIDASADTGTGRIVVPFTNEFMGTNYRYVRVYTAVEGTDVAAGINYTARLAA